MDTESIRRTVLQRKKIAAKPRGTARIAARAWWTAALAWIVATNQRRREDTAVPSAAARKSVAVRAWSAAADPAGVSATFARRRRRGNDRRTIRVRDGDSDV